MEEARIKMNKMGHVIGKHVQWNNFPNTFCAHQILVEMLASFTIIWSIDIVSEYKYVFITAIKCMFLIMHGILNKWRGLVEEFSPQMAGNYI
jgi:hypothetical protein